MPEPKAYLEMTADIVTSMLSNNKLGAEELPGLIGSVYTALADLGQAPITEEEPQREAAVSVRKSLADPDVIISMIDGKPYKMLARHIGLHGYTPQTYREAFNLKPDYPMVAPSYASKRRDLAKKIGLGRKKAVETIAKPANGTPDVGADAPAPKKTRRPRRATASDQSVSS
ncbi:putative transcriptional regulator [Novosphingobium chloroacetimidivorans]|uniref:Putative transcriptional regulator n=1 Tax=Novosphingobium chloroacetimidivorans TaxID=1428314 RepID=A0A7W7KE62_9SPHN|nr:MucR family transcriptional regulator [Novosphingobium chloroacetimidivorans]MBB4860548.1 putative transcriptional regulator [Novosphingobium chloroacetimidivorans]